jgi:hypothetical protein
MGIRRSARFWAEPINPDAQQRVPTFAMQKEKVMGNTDPYLLLTSAK